MIFDLIPHPHNSSRKILIPTYPSFDAWDMYNMLNAAFPAIISHRSQFNFHICCFGGYENAIEFL